MTKSWAICPSEFMPLLFFITHRGIVCSIVSSEGYSKCSFLASPTYNLNLLPKLKIQALQVVTGQLLLYLQTQ